MPSALGAVFAGLGLPADRAAPLEGGGRAGSRAAINLVINTEPEGLAHSHQIVHGPSVVAIGLRVGDAAAALDRAEALGCRPSASRSGRASSTSRRSAGSAARCVYFTDAASELGAGLGDRVRADRGERPPGPLTRIDHVAQSMNPDEMLSWRLWYLSLFDFETTPQVDVIDPAGIVESMALQDPAGRSGSA